MCLSIWHVTIWHVTIWLVSICAPQVLRKCHLVSGDGGDLKKNELISEFKQQLSVSSVTHNGVRTAPAVEQHCKSA